MLILAGVSISAIVGEDGILTKAKNASIASRKAAILEELNLELASYNIDSILKSPEETKTMLGNLITKGLIDTVLSASSEYVANADSPMGIPQFDKANNYTGYIDYAVMKDDYKILISIDDSGIYKAEYGEVNISSGGSVASGTTLVTDKAFNSGEGASAEEQGKFVIDNDASVMFVDQITGELSIQVKSGKHAKVYIFKNMTLTNSGIKRSAIDIEPGGTLDLYVAEGATLTVDSGYGGLSVPASSFNFKSSEGVIGGNGAFAGIHVPKYEVETTIRRVELNEDGSIKRDGSGNAIFTSISYPAGSATLNLSGAGTVIAKGGDAGDGGDGGRNNLDWAAGAGGGAGAGIGGNGGNGATGNNNPHPGEQGEDAGNITISNTVKVYAYGGGGGSGGGVTINLNASGKVDVQSGGGGGGFPAAGIGGGGAGGSAGNTCYSGAGFSNGAGEYVHTPIGGADGKSLTILQSQSPSIGGAYYESYLEHADPSKNALGGGPYQEYTVTDYDASQSCHAKFANHNDLKVKADGGIGGGISTGGTKESDISVNIHSLASNRGGKGATIKVSETAQVFAYNGSYITTKDSSDMSNTERQNTQALIYAQAGYSIEQIRALRVVKKVTARTIADLVTEWSSYSAYRTITSPYTNGTNQNKFILGIGAGAGGYQDNDGNGTYTVDPSMN